MSDVTFVCLHCQKAFTGAQCVCRRIVAVGAPDGSAPADLPEIQRRCEVALSVQVARKECRQTLALVDRLLDRIGG